MSFACILKKLWALVYVASLGYCVLIHHIDSKEISFKHIVLRNGGTDQTIFQPLCGRYHDDYVSLLNYNNFVLHIHLTAVVLFMYQTTINLGKFPFNQIVTEAPEFLSHSWDSCVAKFWFSVQCFLIIVCLFPVCLCIVCTSLNYVF